MSTNIAVEPPFIGFLYQFMSSSVNAQSCNTVDSYLKTVGQIAVCIRETGFKFQCCSVRLDCFRDVSRVLGIKKDKCEIPAQDN